MRRPCGRRSGRQVGRFGGTDVGFGHRAAALAELSRALPLGLAEAAVG